MPILFTRHRTNFRLAEKYDQTLHSHGTVQYFPTVYTELTNRLNLKFCQRFYHLFMRKVLLWQIQNGVFQLGYHASMQPRL